MSYRIDDYVHQQQPSQMGPSQPPQLPTVNLSLYAEAPQPQHHPHLPTAFPTSKRPHSSASPPYHIDTPHLPSTHDRSYTSSTTSPWSNHGRTTSPPAVPPASTSSNPFSHLPHDPPSVFQLGPIGTALPPYEMCQQVPHEQASAATGFMFDPWAQTGRFPTSLYFPTSAPSLIAPPPSSIYASQSSSIWAEGNVINSDHQRLRQAVEREYVGRVHSGAYEQDRLNLSDYSKTFSAPNQPSPYDPPALPQSSQTPPRDRTLSWPFPPSNLLDHPWPSSSSRQSLSSLLPLEERSSPWQGGRSPETSSSRHQNANQILSPPPIPPAVSRWFEPSRPIASSGNSFVRPFAASFTASPQSTTSTNPVSALGPARIRSPSSDHGANTIALPILAPPRPLSGQQASLRTPSQDARGGTLRSGLPVVPNRSPWTMWTGNIPADTTHEELWNFFSSRPLADLVAEDGTPLTTAGVESIHLIARSNCAFVNYISKPHLDHAIKVSNGVALRPIDRKSKPLLCRLRVQEDDARSGVGAQRGGGVHKRYVKRFDRKTRDETTEDDWEARASAEDTGTEDTLSDGSSTSSLFEQYFPKRFFILKAHNNEDLSDSVKTGFWRTQGHNKHTLNQAFRTAKEGVWMVFSANKSGEWFGYARMAGPIGNSGSGNPMDESPLGSGSDSTTTPPNPASVKGEEPSPGVDLASDNDQLGKAFRVEWMRVLRVPFSKTRHLSNSFNMGREVKISRDGTELEPEIGALLLKEFWADAPVAPPRPNPPILGRRTRGSSDPNRPRPWQR